MSDEKVYQRGDWVWSAMMHGYYYAPAGYYEIGLEVDYSDFKFIHDDELHLLIPHLDRDGYIKPRLDERLRVEDLKITHRLLDLLEKKK